MKKNSKEVREKLKNNRFDRFFRKYKWLILLIFLLIILLAEIASEAVICGIQVHRGRPLYIALNRFILSRTFVLPFMRDKTDPLFRDSKQKFIGNLEPVADKAWHRMHPADSILGWKNAPNVKAFSYKKYLYLTNSQGFSSIGESDFYYKREKPPGVFRIIVMGGSTVFGVGTWTPLENLPAQILKQIKKYRPESKIELINAGVDGYSSNQEFMYLMSELVYFSPDLVIIYDGANDLIHRCYGNIENPMKTSTHNAVEDRANKSYSPLSSCLMFATGSANTIKDWLENTGLYVICYMSSTVLKEKMKNIKSKATQKNSHEKEKFTQKNVGKTENIKKKTSSPKLQDNENFKTIRFYKENLEKIIFLSKYYKFKAAFFLQPIMGAGKKTLSVKEKAIAEKFGKTQITYYHDMLKMFQQLKHKYSGDSSVFFKSLINCLDKSPETLYVDKIHINARGNETVAAEIVKTLIEHKFLPVGKNSQISSPTREE